MLEEYTQAITRNPNDAKAYYHRGLVRFALDDKKGAMEDCREAADLYQKQGKISNQDELDQIKKCSSPSPVQALKG